MMPHEKTPRAFRATLAKELVKWRGKGIVDDDGARRISELYRLNETTGSIAAVAVYVLGALLCGGGVISLVAWNWDSIPDVVKVSSVTSLFVALAIAGYQMMQTERWARLGHGLLFLGTLIFGADIGLVAQVFNLSSHWHHGVGAWALGALGMAYATRSAPLGMLSMLLGCVWAVPESFSAESPWFLIVPFMLIAASYPLALIKQSRAMFAVSILSGVVTFLPIAVQSGESAASFFLPLLTAGIALSALASRDRWYSKTAEGMALVLTIGSAYFLSFVEIAKWHYLFKSDSGWFAVALAPPLLWSLGSVLERSTRRAHRPLVVFGMATALVALSLVELPLLVAIVANGLIVVLAAVSIWRSIDTLARGQFWFGLIAGTTLILTRFVEFETGLLLKGLVFVTAGVVVIALGVSFEGRINERRLHA